MIKTCPACGGNHVGVTETRSIKKSLRRRRKCTDCDERWTTYEVPAAMMCSLQEIPNIIATASEASLRLQYLAQEYRTMAEDLGLDELDKLDAVKTRMKGKKPHHI